MSENGVVVVRTGLVEYPWSGSGPAIPAGIRELTAADGAGNDPPDRGVALR